MSDTWTCETHSPEETEALGQALFALLPGGGLVALYGDLAAGKTCLVRGMAMAHGSVEYVSSPTFTIKNEYPGEPPLYHLDLYRIDGPEELFDLGAPELFDPSGGICAIEWAERAESILPKRRIDIHGEHAGGDTRRYRFDNLGGLLPDGWVERLEKELTAARK